ncbi:1233_t:CDS:10, partial [Paraglomus brasilianum]
MAKTACMRALNNAISRRHISSKSMAQKHGLYHERFEAVIGLEIHAQINSKSKLFSSSSASFNKPVSSNVSVIDAAFPGTIPKLNKKCVDLAVATAFALSGEVQRTSSFDRKHYFYPDLPAGYQITQHYAPLSVGGQIRLSSLDGLNYEKLIRIKQLQIEQDTGKSIRDVRPGMTLVDLNRAGIGLMEIVTEPDIRSPIEAGLVVRKLQALMRALGSSDGNMEEGSLRCDVNVSVHEPDKAFGIRCEIKNLNSIKFLVSAIDAEIQRQIQDICRGVSIVQETRGYDVSSNGTYRLREKETAPDYRYMPESDLPQLVLSEDYLRHIKDSLPELPDDTKKRLIKKYNLSLNDASTLLGESGGIEYFENVAAAGRNPQHVVNWITHELWGRLNSREIRFQDNPVSPEQLGSLIDCVVNDTISGRTGKDILNQMIDGDRRLAFEIVEANGLRQLSDPDELSKICMTIIKRFPQQ